MDPIREELFRQLSHRIVQGLTTEQIAREIDYQQSYLEQLLVSDEFKTFFEKEDPTSYAAWRQVREEEEVDVEVQHFLQSKALLNAKKMQALADSGELRPADELRARENLLKMSGKIKEDAVTEVVTISKAHLAAMREGAKDIE